MLCWWHIDNNMRDTQAEGSLVQYFLVSLRLLKIGSCLCSYSKVIELPQNVRIRGHEGAWGDSSRTSCEDSLREVLIICLPTWSKETVNPWGTHVFCPTPSRLEYATNIQSTYPRLQYSQCIQTNSPKSDVVAQTVQLLVHFGNSLHNTYYLSQQQHKSLQMLNLINFMMRRIICYTWN